MKRCFWTIALQRIDLEELGVNANSISDNKMEEIGNEIGAYLIESGIYNNALDHVVKQFNLK